MAEASFRRVVALAAVTGGVVAAAIGLAACGGSGSPQVASLGRSGGGARAGASNGRSATTPATGDPTRLLDAWATCMRRHGDPSQVDPTITADKVIVINWNPAIPGGYNGTNKGGQGNSGPGQYCRAYLNAAQTALRGGSPLHPPSLTTLLKFSRCMQANGIADFPDPTANGLSMNVGGDLTPTNPAFLNASRLCARKTGAKVPFAGGTPPPGTITLAGGELPGAG